jgi:hypothetical protein
MKQRLFGAGLGLLAIAILLMFSIIYNFTFGIVLGVAFLFISLFVSGFVLLLQ